MQDKQNTRPVNIAVFVSGGGTNLQALIDAQESGIIKSGRIRLVIASRSDAYALERAANAGIDAFAISKKMYESQEAAEKEIEKKLSEYEIDLIVLAGYLSILSADFTRRWDHRIINIHPALIPSFCGKGFYGLKVHEEALRYGVKVTGATTHFVNEIPDGGEIIMQKAVSVEPGDTPEVLQRRVMEQAEWIILPLSVEKTAAAIKTERDSQ
ncbi:MAG: phosphoribosylglycinamide formyltransferase [Lachnospiraceae bacterium]|nr:phosphoribosylglycinamide formyltransferase [Lachnospiraceae bacterium]